jgi:alkaline phosphatase D
MKYCFILLTFGLFFAMAIFSKTGFCQSVDTIPPRHKVTLPEAHIGNLEIDTKLLDSYLLLPNPARQFYLDARSVFSTTGDANFTHPKIVKAAQENQIMLMGGPMLGNLKEDEITIWLRPSTKIPLAVKVIKSIGSDEKSVVIHPVVPGMEQRIKIEGLSPDSDYEYTVYAENQTIAKGHFRTSPVPGEKSKFRLTFGSCFHKIGLHNPNLIHQILERKPQAMMLLGDISVDDRENRIAMHLSDYLLRDMSLPWQKLAANVPLYTAWDDHDYLNNDLSGIPARFTTSDQEALRKVWQQNWNNPENKSEGIYFHTRTGPVELIMLDTRSCRNVEQRGHYGSYLGTAQLKWLKEVLLTSTAPFKVISSGTMWSDYITEGKDSWGTWDTLAREEIFHLIETEKISGVLLISGDRHGARGFTILRPSGFSLHEFEVASLGGVPGPEAMAKDPANQLFGYHGSDIIAFGEFTFDTSGNEPFVIFRLIGETGIILYELGLPYRQLIP